MKLKICDHCLETCNTLTAVGACAEASSSHYAMALVRSMRAEGRTLFEVFEFLELISEAPELAPRRLVDEARLSPYFVSLPIHGLVQVDAVLPSSPFPRES
jgi:hypothetical protein